MLLTYFKRDHVQINIYHHMTSTSASMYIIYFLVQWSPWCCETDFSMILPKFMKYDKRNALKPLHYHFAFLTNKLAIFVSSKMLHYTKICENSFFPCRMYVQLQKLVNENNNNCNCKNCKCKEPFWLLHAYFASCFPDTNYDASDEQVNNSACDVAPT